MKRTRLGRSARIATVAGITAASLGIGGAAYGATTSGAKASTSPSSGSSTATHGVRRHLGLLARTVHAQLVVRTASGYRTIDLDRGTLDSISSTAISLTRPDGPTVDATITSSTHFRGKTEAELTPGSKVLLASANGTALVVASRLAGSSSANGATSTGSGSGSASSGA